MLVGDLVRCLNWGSAVYEEVGIVVEYEKWEKIASVLIQSTGEVKRVPANHLQLVKRAPQNVELLKKLLKKAKKA
jgi:hypothetical protein